MLIRFSLTVVCLLSVACLTPVDESNPIDGGAAGGNAAGGNAAGGNAAGGNAAGGNTAGGNAAGGNAAGGNAAGGNAAGGNAAGGNAAGGNAAGGNAAGGNAAGGEVEPVAPLQPITQSIDAILTSPPAVESDTPAVNAGCRGNAYLAGVTAPPQCLGQKCLTAVNRNGVVTLLDTHSQPIRVLGVKGSKVVYRRDPNTLMIVDVSGSPVMLGTLPTASLQPTSTSATIDGSDVLVSFETRSANIDRTLVMRYPSGTTILDAPGMRRSDHQVDGSGRVWIRTSQGVFRSAPRGAPSLTTSIPSPSGVGTPYGGSFHVLPSGNALLAEDNKVWLTLSTGASTLFATLPNNTTGIRAIAPWQGGFVAIAGNDVFVTTGTGPLRRVLIQNMLSSYFSHENWVSASGANIYLNTLCHSISSYPGYDTAIINPNTGTALWWWQMYTSQHDIPVLPAPSSTITGGFLDVRAPTLRSTAGFIVVF
jgi:hypothetical protein